jgi:PAS domain S-box-containing protein
MIVVAAGDRVPEIREYADRLLELSPDGILISHHDRIVFLNASAVRLLGATSPAQFLGKSPLDLFHPQSRLIGDSSQPLVEAKLARADGAETVVEVSVTRLTDEAATTVQVAMLILRDISGRKRVEAALRDNEERLALAFEGSKEGVWDWNLETGFVLYSPRWKQMLGYADDEIEPHVSAWERLLHPDDTARASEVYEHVARGGQNYEGEFRLRHKEGHYVPVLSRGFPVRRQPGGPVVRIVGTHFDLTEQKRSEAALRESEERLRLAFDGAQEGVWDWNLETGSVVYSPRWKQMLGYADDEIEPHVSAWERLLHPDDWSRADQVSESVARGAATYEGEFRLRHKEGHYVHVLSRGFPVRLEPGGPVVRIVGTHFDLTARKRAETERARTEFLSRLVFAQEDERRRIAREMHDQFGEQLTTLGLRIRALKDACSDQPKFNDHFAALETVAQQIDRDVDHLVWELRPTALDDLGLRAALEDYVHNWSKRANIVVNLHMSGRLDDRLASDTETTLYRIAQEALTNVARHSRARNVEVILERRNDSVLLVVEDDGVGFDPDTSGEAGHGFGLIGMQERAALVGATLEIESSAGKGTTILVRIAAGPRSTSADHV